MILFIRKVIDRLLFIYRKKVFEAYTQNKGKNIKIYGKMTLINRNKNAEIMFPFIRMLCCLEMD